MADTDTATQDALTAATAEATRQAEEAAGHVQTLVQERATLADKLAAYIQSGHIPQTDVAGLIEEMPQLREALIGSLPQGTVK